MKDIKRKLIFSIFLIIVGISSVYAYNLCQARDVTYSPKDTTWDVSNVQEAISDLYKDKCGSANTCGDIAEPKFYDDEAFIPVTIDDDGTVRRADITTNWYDYCDKRWANAVMLNKYIDDNSSSDTTSESSYTKVPEYKPGDIIKEDDIQSYFVWIPKFKYKLWNVNSDGKSTGATKLAHSIDIVFDKNDTTDVEGVSCAAPLLTGESGNCDNGEYMTHPAFISMGVTGFWVGKFEASDADIIYADSSTDEKKQINYERGVSLKPNHSSKTNITVKEMFETSYNYNRELDSHMMKNTEWGAVAYLSHSKYGINKKVNINNSTPKITGVSALPSTNQQTYPGTYGAGSDYYDVYNSSIGYLASTTGNITGIYDMAGGAIEYMASYLSTKFGSSGFNATSIATYDEKYFDIYNASSSQTTFQYRILGDATGEMGPFKTYMDNDGTSRYHDEWYRSTSSFATTASTYAWFNRGQASTTGVLANQFAFQGYNGAANAGRGYRLVLS